MFLALSVTFPSSFLLTHDSEVCTDQNARMNSPYPKKVKHKTELLKLLKQF